MGTGYVLSVRDKGVGLPEGFEGQRRKTLGMTIIKALTDQLDGTLQTASDGGACFTVRFRV